MTKRDKLLARIRKNPRHVSMRELRTLLESFGFALDRVKGSHQIFVGIVAGEGVTLVIPFRSPHIRAGYVRDALELIDQIMMKDQEEHDSEDS